MYTLLEDKPPLATAVFGMDGNAVVGPATEFDSEQTIGDHGIGIRSAKGSALVEFAVSANICLANTFHACPTGEKYTCDYDLKFPPQQIDYIGCDWYLLQGRSGVCQVSEIDIKNVQIVGQII